MDIDPPPRKRSFAPKKLDSKRNKGKATQTKPVVHEEDEGDDEVPQQLIRRLHEHLGRERPKLDRKAKEVAFFHGSSQLKTFGRQGESSGQRGSAAQNVLSSPWIAETDGVAESTGTSVDPLPQKKKKEYEELWDYNHSYCPISLPLRRPYSGDPEEFGAENENLTSDEDSIRAASALGLLEESDDPRLIFLQLPAKLPRVELAAGGGTTDRGRGTPTVERSSNVSEHAKGSKTLDSSGKRTPLIRQCGLEELPRGHVGKMLVYKSGAVKLKLGDVICDVSPGTECTSSQNVAAVNTVRKQCCDVGELATRAVVTPDIDFLLKQQEE